jgi:glucose/arabinose dehydrogenase
MSSVNRLTVLGKLIIAASLLLALAVNIPVTAQTTGPTMLDPNLGVRPVVTGLTTPTTLAFLANNDFLVLEKITGKVQRVRNGVIIATVLDLAVNFASERGLLGIALQPNFKVNRGVFLYWTESSTGADTNVFAETSLLGNRVDRYIWNGSQLVFDTNVVRIRAIQQDAGQPERGNHDGGVLAFDKAGKLFVFTGDLGRRGWMQNLPCGPTATCPGDTVPDDQFGGPEADNAHLSGMVLRLNVDGSAPSDNPFYAAGEAIGGEVGANIQKLLSYGHRNGFGMAMDPGSGFMWAQENGDDSFSELNRLEPGMNGGWIQIAGPVSRVAQFREIETTFGAQALQQIRWPPTNIAMTPEEALARLFMLPGAHYSDPEFSWAWEMAPGGIGFVNSLAFGKEYKGDLLMGAATPNLMGGYLFRFNLVGKRDRIGVDDPRLADLVADNLAKHEITESESLLIGTDFGVGTDIETAPNGNVYVVSLTHGTIYEIYRR